MDSVAHRLIAICIMKSSRSLSWMDKNSLSFACSTRQETRVFCVDAQGQTINVTRRDGCRYVCWARSVGPTKQTACFNNRLRVYLSIIKVTWAEISISNRCANITASLKISIITLRSLHTELFSPALGGNHFFFFFCSSWLSNTCL